MNNVMTNTKWFWFLAGVSSIWIGLIIYWLLNWFVVIIISMLALS